ncbi:NAD(P)-dependent oxidoreductase [SAR202 cluster bacterium AD-804-J14_MRT_500m]|nr:NAD(P)-dependent oxidoreductase [SAR202 cluster bacterium AD-804-J14_MRT_500m]
MTERRILVTGGCGYIGSVLVPKIASKYQVTVLDSMAFGNQIEGIPNVTPVKGDIRDYSLVNAVLDGVTDVIHLAAIANDPSSDLDPDMTRAVNRDAIVNLVGAAKSFGIHRFISASSSSVYGIKEEESVTEELSLCPLTLYAELKAESEKIVGNAADDSFTTTSIRSATVCGVSPRMRFDVIVNIMAKLAATNQVITVWGGDQQRPNIHIEDITDLYQLLLDTPTELINGKIFNVGAPNHSVKEIAMMAKEEIGGAIEIDSGAADNRSYRISSEKIKRELGYVPQRSIRQAMRDIKQAFDNGRFQDFDDDIYYNVRMMKRLQVGG